MAHGLKGRPKSPEHLAKMRSISEARRGIPVPEETRAKISAALAGKRPKNLESLWGKLRGRTLTAEHKAKLSAAHRSRAVPRAKSSGMVVGKRATIYGLASSRDGQIKYVGQTAVSLAARFRSHQNAARNGCGGPLYSWMRKEAAQGHSVFQFVVERDAEYNFAEQRHIAWYRKHGARLLNLTAGGHGNVGYVVSEESRKRMSNAATGIKRTLTNEERQRRAAQITAITSRPDVRAKISASQRGKPKTAEAIAKRTETRRRNSGGTYGGSAWFGH